MIAVHMTPAGGLATIYQKKGVLQNACNTP